MTERRRDPWPMVAAGAVGAFVLLAVVALFLPLRRSTVIPPPTPSVAPITGAPVARLSPLAPEPAWGDLEKYTDALTVGQFREARERVYGNGGTSWDGWLSISEGMPSSVRIARVGAGGLTSAGVVLGMEGSVRPSRFWREASELPPSSDPATRPLEGVKVALDPGHIGGLWARMEERWYQPPGETVAVTEGDLTLAVARLLKPTLEGLGATVSMVRDTTEPVTALRPADFEGQATSRSQAELFFYRKAEIRARSEMVNRQIQPDMVVCLHFNAEPWGDPAQVAFAPANHLHLIVNGHYDASELAYDDVRFEMLLRLFQRIEPEELRLADAVSKSLAAATGLPPYDYAGGHMAANAHRPLPDNPFVWARNLMANRLYLCPVVFCEPYVMNNREVFDRIAAGDYPGEKPVAGQSRKSIFREYADAVAGGLRAHVAATRKQSNP